MRWWIYQYLQEYMFLTPSYLLMFSEIISMWDLSFFPYSSPKSAKALALNYELLLHLKCSKSSLYIVGEFLENGTLSKTTQQNQFYHGLIAMNKN